MGKPPGGSGGVNIGGTKKSGTDDDEDVDRGGDRVGGSSGIKPPRAIEKIRIIEQVRRRRSTHHRHQQLHVRKDGGITSRAGDTVEDVLPSILDGTAILLPTSSASTLSSAPESLNSSANPSVPSGTLAPPTSPSGFSDLPDVPIGSTEQVVLSSTPPPSPAETYPGMVIPTITSTTISSTSPPAELSSTTTSSASSPVELSSTTTSSASSPVGLSSTTISSASSPAESSSTTGSTSPSSIPSPYTTITSQLPPLTTRINGTATSDTGVAFTTTTEGIIVYTSPPVSTGVINNTLTGSYTNSSTLSSSSLPLNTTSTISSPSSSSSSSSFSSTSSSPSWYTTTELGGGGGGGAGGGQEPTTYVGPTGSPTATSLPNGGPPVSPTLLGGVLGGVAGFAFVLMAILLLLRRYRRERAIQDRDDAGYGGALDAGTGGGGDGERSMAQRSTKFPLAGGLLPMRSRQGKDPLPETPPAPEERGFYKVSGRKLPPVIGGPRPGEFSSGRSAAGSSSYHDDDISWVGGPGTPVSWTGAGPSRYSGVSAGTPSSPATSSGPTSATTPVGPAPLLPPMGTSITGPPRIPEERESDPELATSQEPMPRPPPMVRQPSTPGSQTEVALGTPIRPPFRRGMSSGSAGSGGSGKDGQGGGGEGPVASAIPAALARQIGVERPGKDGVGRSLPSHDGSRTSRFTEDIV